MDLVERQIGKRVQAVHRLDEDTSGVFVLALTERGRVGMEDLFRRHEVEREYLALLTGTPSPAAGTVRSQVRDEGGVVRVVERGGQPAITHYESLGRRGRCCLVRCRLETGRRNQIRVHMAALGCPVAGDRKYGYRARPGESYPRVMLHSHRIAFRHPMSGSEIRAEVEAPEADLRT
jgi:RluA family pseudouridine synthase